MKYKAISMLALSACVANCGKPLPPLQVLPTGPKQAPMAKPPAELLTPPGCVLRPISFCEEPRTKSGTNS